MHTARSADYKGGCGAFRLFAVGGDGQAHVKIAVGGVAPRRRRTLSRRAQLSAYVLHAGHN